MEKIASAKDPLDVEEAWGGDKGFMDTWQDPEWEMWKGIGDHAFAVLTGEGPMSAVSGGVTNGVKLAILCMGYDLRVGYYVNLIDDI